MVFEILTKFGFRRENGFLLEILASLGQKCPQEAKISSIFSFSLLKPIFSQYLKKTIQNNFQSCQTYSFSYTNSIVSRTDLSRLRHPYTKPIGSAKTNPTEHALEIAISQSAMPWDQAKPLGQGTPSPRLRKFLYTMPPKIYILATSTFYQV